MIYEWRCSVCGKVHEVQRSIADRDVPPDAIDIGMCAEGSLKRVITKNAALIIGPDFYDGIDTPYGHGIGVYKGA